MKFLSLFLFTILFSSSCCGAKITTTKEIAQVETPTLPEPPKTIEVVEEIKPEIEVETEVETEIVIEPEVEIETLEKPIETFNHTAWNNLLQKYVSNNGNVNYKGFKSNHTALRNYISSLSENLPTESWSKNEKLAYWMNAYNAMTVDLIVRNYPLKSIKDIDKPWEQRLWELGDKWYNLEEIEHQILRKMNEPRIHFGIVCASYSCPKLLNEAFEASNVGAQLTKATKEFLSDSKRNNISANKIKLSKIFSWFAKDFKQDGSLIDFLNKYSEITISKNAKKSFKEYIWTLNE